MARLGAHVSAAGGLHLAVARAEEIGAESFQIFTANPRQWAGKSISDAEAEAFRRALLDSSIRSVVSHASYLINLAGDDGVRERSRAALAEEIARCDLLGIDLVVLHPGSSVGRDREDAKERVADALEKVLGATDRTNVSVLLETMAGSGGSLGSTIAELADIIERLGWPDRLGICADTCHLFAAGIDIRSAAGYERTVETMRRQVSLSRVRCWHLNDSRSALGSRVDRHEHIGEGELGTAPFALIVGDERFAQTPAILETPKDGGGDAANLALLRKLRGDEALR